jgi:hypothetical protein
MHPRPAVSDNGDGGSAGGVSPSPRLSPSRRGSKAGGRKYH